MPPRRSTGRTASRQQSTLSFGTNTRVTKPSATVPGKQIKDIEPIATNILKEATRDTSLPEQAPVAPPSGSSKPHVAEIAVREQTKKELEQPLTEEDRQALKVTDAALRKYWNEEEQRRTAPRVHQNGLDVNEKILRHFDLSSQYGPCIGISRIKRWRRAYALDLNPPIEVLAVLLKEGTGGTGQVKERAYVDELLS
ncbi:putative DNA polymerase delta subunit 4 [Talaromyces proteolyticus]|uniref:DNA polymerase delta subunit 4 n=1 Tax=Talaromyces proteolyticus TaxID=1131652 RepID=A0AAD4KMX3_9EURO|nr:putative DNA polymerase delta subunit 4 [Talaromyces proteolyticus]KAH8696328.1 putative DNA polymerase delta subunit 4 [Talaromyces proteolyticus]